MRASRVLSFSLIALLFLLTLQPLASQHNGVGLGDRAGDLRIRIVLENDRTVSAPVSVQLLTGAGTPFQEEVSNDRGEVQFRSVPAGDYRVKIFGVGIKEMEALVSASAGNPTQFVRVESSVSNQAYANGYISAKQLAIPEKARKEFDKGVHDMGESNLGNARKHFLKANELSPNYAAALNNLGVIATKENDNVKAYEYFQKAVAADENYAQGLINLGRIEMVNKNLKAAIAPLEKARSLTPTDAQIFNLLAVAQIQLGDADSALVNARRVHTLEHKHFAVSHYIAASILAKRGLRDDAVAEYELFLKEETKDAPLAKIATNELKQLKTQALAVK